MTMKKIILTILSTILARVCVACNITLPSSDKNSESSGKGESETVYLFQASESTASKFYNVGYGTPSETVVATYVAKEDLPGMLTTGTGAAKLPFYSSAWNKFDKLFLELDYTATELEEMKSTYRAAKFSIYFEFEASHVYQTKETHAISFVEFFNSGWFNNQVQKNTWSSYEILLADLISCISAENKAYIFSGIFPDGTQNRNMNVYISDIVLVKKLGA